MTDTALQTDKSLGLGLLFGLVTLAGAAVMYVASADQTTAGWGFALAMVAGAIAVSAIHVFADR
jgi:hypothetical protein